jgi:antitoxin HigA-1
MAEYAANRSSRCPTHPGAAIADVLQDVDVSKVSIAKQLGISRQHLYDIINGDKPLSASLAVRVAALLGGSAESWLRMQAACDAWHATRSVDVSKIKRLEVA